MGTSCALKFQPMQASKCKRIWFCTNLVISYVIQQSIHNKQMQHFHMNIWAEWVNAVISCADD
jgi:hypothetical protein